MSEVVMKDENELAYWENEIIQSSNSFIHFTKHIKIWNAEELCYMSFYDVMLPFQQKFTHSFNDSFFLQNDAPQHYIMKVPRQSGKTTQYAATALWACLFNEKYEVAVFAHGKEGATDVLSKIKTTYEELPEIMQIGVKEWNKSSVIFNNGSRIRCQATTEKSGRGLTVNLLVLDEYAFVQGHLGDKFFKAVEPSIKAAGQRGHILIASTPNGMNKFYDMWQAAGKKNSGYMRIEAKWNEPKGRDEKFKEQYIKVNGELQWLQEYECEFLGSSSTLLSPEAMSSLSAKSPGINWTNVLGAECWVKVDPNAKYIIGVDTADGVGADYSVATVIRYSPHLTAFTLCAILRTNNVAPHIFAGNLWKLSKYYNNAIMNIEKQGAGNLVIHEIQKIAQANKCYNMQTGKIEHNMTSFDFGRSIGIQATGEAKYEACMFLKQIIESKRFDPYSEEMIAELLRFTKSGSSYRAVTGHDDIVMSTAWAVYKIQDIINDNPIQKKEKYACPMVEKFGGKRWIMF